jgi:hypothetical protein
VRPEYLFKLGMHIIRVVHHGVGVAHLDFGLLQFIVDELAVQELFVSAIILKADQNRFSYAIVCNDNMIVLL